MLPEELPADLPLLRGLAVELVPEDDYRRGLVGELRLMLRGRGCEAGTFLGPYR
jgi:hypothetical protein